MIKHCPSCRSEFRPEISTCPDCDVALELGAPPDRDARAEERSIELVRTRDRLFLTRLLGILDEAGVAYEIGEGIVLSAIVGDISQPVRVHVLEKDEASAREIVEALREGADSEDGDDPGVGAIDPE